MNEDDYNRECTGSMERGVCIVIPWADWWWLGTYMQCHNDTQWCLSWIVGLLILSSLVYLGMPAHGSLITNHHHSKAHRFKAETHTGNPVGDKVQNGLTICSVQVLVYVVGVCSQWMKKVTVIYFFGKLNRFIDHEEVGFVPTFGSLTS